MLSGSSTMFGIRYARLDCAKLGYNNSHEFFIKYDSDNNLLFKLSLLSL